MSNKKKCADRRNVSVDKLQKLFSKLLLEVAGDSESLPVRKGTKGFTIYVENHGTLNFTFNEKGGLK